MRILHYCLGMLPYRRGGLVKYSLDVARAQQQDSNNQIIVLYPGEDKLFIESKIIKQKKYFNIEIYELINPIYVPLLRGVSDPDDILKPRKNLSQQKIRDFLETIQVDIIHIHTLMGLSSLFLSVAHDLKIKTVFTTHDYYGLCLKVNFIDNSGMICRNIDIDKCAQCNYKRNSKISMFFQSKKILYNPFFKNIYKNISGWKHFGCKTSDKKSFVNVISERYGTLLNEYSLMIKKMDKILFNSSVSQDIYEKYLGCLPSKKILISNMSITDRRFYKEVNKNQLNIGYIGATTDYKGFPLLLSVLNKAKMNGFCNWKLIVYTESIPLIKDVDEKIEYRKPYTSLDYKKVFSEFDILVCPSICFETFGFVALEAISFGVPVIISSTMGVKDIVAEIDNDMVVYPDFMNLYSMIINLLADTKKIDIIRQKIIKSKIQFDFNKHINELNKVYKEVIES